jgi:hypothetical protein
MLTPFGSEQQVIPALPCRPIESLPAGPCAGGILRENPFTQAGDHPVGLYGSAALAAPAGT